jgi:polysaccharide chain length determinant protein (PEP-CTERM system associated)
MLPNKKLSLGMMFGLVGRRVWLIVIPPIVGLFIGLVFSSTIPDYYQSEMLIAIIPQRVPDSFVRSTITLRVDERLDEISVQVKSRTNLEQMITEMGLYPELRSRMPMEDVVAKMRNDLVVGLEPARRGPRGPEPPNAFHIRFTYTNAATAATVTQKIGALYVEQNSKGRGALARATASFLDSELDQARRKLEAQEAKLEDFRQKHGKELPTQLQTNLEAARGLQMQVQALVESIARDRDRKLMLERLYREASSEPPVMTTSARTGGGAEQVTAGMSLTRQLETAKTNLSALEARYTASHPDVVRTRSQIAELEQRIAAESKAASAATTATGRPATPDPVDPTEAARRENLRQMLAEIESLDRQTTFKEGEEKRLRGEISEYHRRVEAVPGIESEWVSLSRDYDSNQLAYSELLTKAEAARVAVNLEEREIGEQFRIVDPAQVPVHPVTSLRPAVNGGGLLLGLLIGFGMTLFLEMRDSSYRTDADVIDVLSLPVLALVPGLVDEARRVRERKRKMILSAVGLACLAGMGYMTWALKLWNSVI